MTGYTDGTFRPDETVKLEEACAAVLKLLGYDTSALAGSFPSAQLSKAAALGLRACRSGAFIGCRLFLPALYRKSRKAYRILRHAFLKLLLWRQ